MDDVEVGLEESAAGGARRITWCARCLVGWKACVSKTTAVKISLEELGDNAVAFKLTTHYSKEFDLDVRMDLAAVLLLRWSLAHKRLCSQQSCFLLYNWFLDELILLLPKKIDDH